MAMCLYCFLVQLCKPLESSKLCRKTNNKLPKRQWSQLPQIFLRLESFFLSRSEPQQKNSKLLKKPMSPQRNFYLAVDTFPTMPI